MLRTAIRLMGSFGPLWGLRIARQLRNRSTYVEFPIENRSYFLPHDSSVLYHLLHSIEKWQRLTDCVDTGANVIVDVGAHAGLFSALVKRHHPDTFTLIVEPFVNGAIERNLSGCKGFQVVFKAVSDSEGEVPFFINPASTQTNSLLPEAAEEFGESRETRVEATTLDKLCVEYDSIDMLKVDVQGAEHLVLRGGQETLKRTRQVLIEVSLLDPYADEVLRILRNEFGPPRVVNEVRYGADLLYAR